MRILLIFVFMLFCATPASAQEEPEFRPVTPGEMLLQSAWEGDEDSVRTLLDEGIEVNPQCPQRPPQGEQVCSPLIYAAQKGHDRIAALLLGVGANVNVREAGGDTPLHHALRAGKDDTAKMLVSFGADINLRNNDGVTPFMMACRDGRLDFVKLFITKGADLKTADAAGRTARDFAVEAGQQDTVAFLDSYRRDFLGEE